MSFIILKNEEATKVTKIDAQHEAIVSIINDLHELLPSEEKEQKSEKLNELLTVLKDHFATEENLMKEFRFENTFSHTQEHNKLIDKLIKYKNDFNADKIDLNLEFLISIKNWFHNHNKINDIKLGKFLNSLGVK